nr:hypothetical protein [Candidatus Sigynarchaeum springense]
MGGRCIFATNTVDIGFNFNRNPALDQGRQNIDFLFIDFRTYDEFAQRLGRAGRVLGKRITDEPSDVHVFVPELRFKKIYNLVKDPALLAGKSRPEIVNLFKEVFDERVYHQEFFEQYGLFIATIFVDTIRKYAIVEKWRPERDPEVEAVFSEWERVLSAVYGSRDRWTSKLHLLYNRSSKAHYQDLDPKYKYDFLYHYFVDWSFRSSDLAESMTPREKLFQQGLSKGLDPDQIKPGLELIAQTLKPGDASTADTITAELERVLSNGIDTYYQFTKLFFNELRLDYRPQAFPLVFGDRHSESDQVTIQDPHNLMGSDQFGYGPFHVISWYKYDLVEDEPNRAVFHLKNPSERYQPVSFVFDLSTRPLMAVQIFEKGIDGSRGMQFLFRMVFFVGNSLRVHTGNSVTPRIISERLKHPLIGYIAPLQYRWILRMPSFELVVRFPGNVEEKYCVFFGHQAIKARASIFSEGE